MAFRAIAGATAQKREGELRSATTGSLMCHLAHRAWYARRLHARTRRAPEWLLMQLRMPSEGAGMQTFRVQRTRADYRVTVTDALSELGLQLVSLAVLGRASV